MCRCTLPWVPDSEYVAFWDPVGKKSERQDVMESLPYRGKMAGIAFWWTTVGGFWMGQQCIWGGLCSPGDPCHAEMCSYELDLLQKLPVSRPLLPSYLWDSMPESPVAGLPGPVSTPLGQDYGKMAVAWPSFSVCIWSLRNSCIFIVVKIVHRCVPPPSCLPPPFSLCLRSTYLQYLVSWGPHTMPIIHLSCLINVQTFLSHSEWYLLLAPLYRVDLY